LGAWLTRLLVVGLVLVAVGWLLVRWGGWLPT
jgi:hypothetical protein